MDPGKKTTGRKRHSAADTDGHLRINFTLADIAGAIPVLEALMKRWPGLKHLFCNGAYDRTALIDKAEMIDFVGQGRQAPRELGRLFRRCPDTGWWSARLDG